MSKPVKDMIASEYGRRFKGVTGAVVVEIRGLNAQATTTMRGSMRAKGIQVAVVKNALARRSFKGGPLGSIEKALVGPSAMLFGPESAIVIAREVVKAATDDKKIVLKGAIFDSEYFDGEDGVKRLSAMPTRAEAQSKIVTLLLSPARNIMGVVKEIQERLEKGESIARV